MSAWTGTVTFEYDTDTQPISVKVSTEAGSAATATARLVRLARKQAKSRRWSSLVVVLQRQREATTPAGSTGTAIG